MSEQMIIVHRDIAEDECEDWQYTAVRCTVIDGWPSRIETVTEGTSETRVLAAARRAAKREGRVLRLSYGE